MQKKKKKTTTFKITNYGIKGWKMTSKDSVQQKKFCILEDQKPNISQWDHTKNISEEDINLCWTLSKSENL